MKLLKDPLLQFLVIGAVLWIGHTLTTAPPPNVIHLPQSLSDPAGDAQGNELKGDTRQQYIDQQVLIREARRLGLQYNDSIIERQLQQKMRLLLEANAPQEISDNDLETWISEQGDRYHQPATVTLRQKLFRRSEFGDQAKQKATAALQQLSANQVGSADLMDASIGAPLTAQSQALLRKRFGKAFASAVFSEALAPTSVQTFEQPESSHKPWLGPVQTGLGWQIFQLIERHTSQPMPFGAVKQKALLDWRAEQEHQAFLDGLETLKQRYVIAP